jgi:hypothetical protein
LFFFRSFFPLRESLQNNIYAADILHKYPGKRYKYLKKSGKNDDEYTMKDLAAFFGNQGRLRDLPNRDPRREVWKTKGSIAEKKVLLRALPWKSAYRF